MASQSLQKTRLADMKGQHLSDSGARFAVAQPESRDYVVRMIQNPPVLQSSLLNFINRLKDGA